jgi:hypothetical protein
VSASDRTDAPSVPEEAPRREGERERYPDLSPAATFAAPFRLRSESATKPLTIRGEEHEVVPVPREPGDEARKIVDLVRVRDGRRFRLEDLVECQACDCPAFRQKLDCDHLRAARARGLMPAMPATFDQCAPVAGLEWGLTPGAAGGAA